MFDTELYQNEGPKRRAKRERERTGIILDGKHKQKRTGIILDDPDKPDKDRHNP